MIDFGKFCNLCDLFINECGVSEEKAEYLAGKVWDILGCQPTDGDMIPTYFAQLASGLVLQEN